MVKRTAFTMIELIIAIVIMGIVFISIPFILLNNARSVEQNLMQESILLSATKMGQILSYRWDENSIDTTATTTLAKTEVLDTNGNAALARNAVDDDFRVGHFQEALHRKMTPNAAARAATAIGIEGTVLDDIDDFNGQNENIGSTAGAVGYKKSYSLQPSVAYISDTPSTNNYASASLGITFPSTGASGVTTNIKRVIVTSVNPDMNISLFSYSCNIGETDYYSRRY